MVVKLGSNALLDRQGNLNEGLVLNLSHQIGTLRDAGLRPIVVSSGAVACGRETASGRGDGTRRSSLAALGQARLAACWTRSLAWADLDAAQVLITEPDLADADRSERLGATLEGLADAGAVPVVNENDTVSGPDASIGDNDWIAAEIAVRLRAAHVLFLSNVDGVYDADPRIDATARRVPVVDDHGEALLAAAGGPDPNGTGGMRSKLIAARLAARAGTTATIARATTPRVVPRALAHDESVGTRLIARRVPGRPAPALRFATSQLPLR